MSRFTYRTWGGASRFVDADEVRFEATHVAFWNRSGGTPYRSQRLVFAIREVDCNDLREVEPEITDVGS